MRASNPTLALRTVRLAIVPGKGRWQASFILDGLPDLREVYELRELFVEAFGIFPKWGVSDARVK
jgi:hypothetical protein